jgi:hypothetical protein
MSGDAIASVADCQMGKRGAWGLERQHGKFAVIAREGKGVLRCAQDFGWRLKRRQNASSLERSDRKKRRGRLRVPCLCG